MSNGTLTYVAQWENNNHQESCPYLIAWAGDYSEKADIIQVDFKCIQEAPSTYYAAQTWGDGTPGDGYAGFQILEDGTHVLIMSIWDNGALKPTIEYSPYIRGNEDFGGEGTGKYVVSNYDWSNLCWYTMRIQARSTGRGTVYEQWIRPENGSWEKICAISLPKADCGFVGIGTFLEDFYPFSNMRRSMQIRNAAARSASTGEWQANKQYNITNYDDQHFNKMDVNYNCKAEAASDSALYMQSGGSGYENVIQIPKTIQLKKCEIIDRFILD